MRYFKIQGTIQVPDDYDIDEVYYYLLENIENTGM